MSNKLYYTQIEKIEPIEGADKIVVATILGSPIVVGAESKVGDTGYLYMPDAVLTDEAVEIFGESILNYVGKNRRVKAIKLKGVYSIGMFVPFNSLAHEIDGAVPESSGLWRTYNPPNVRAPNMQKGGVTGLRELPTFPMHFSTEQYLANTKRLMTAANSPDTTTTISLKMHGTSQRTGNVIVEKKLNWLQRTWNSYFGFFGEFPTMERKLLNGSRRVILSDNTENQYHSLDFRSRVRDTIEPFIKDDEVWFYEVVGWESVNKSIMPGDFSYGVPKGDFAIYVYRITHAGVDFPAEMLEDVINVLDHPKIYAVPTLMRFNGGLPEGIIEELMELVESEAFKASNGGHLQEGLCIRVDDVDGRTPLILKYKSKAFLVEECGHDPEYQQPTTG